MLGCVMKLLLVSRGQLPRNIHVQSFPRVQEAQDRDTLHHARRRVAKKLASRLQRAVDPNVVLGSHEEVAGLGRVVGCLLGDVVALGAVWVVPVASEDLAQDGVQGLLHASALLSAIVSHWFHVCAAYGGLMCQPLT